MLKNKILLKITGSIAAYKSAYLVSRLIQSGYEVKVVMSKAAEKFIGTITFEALTGSPVYTDMFARREALSHINLMKWADLIIVAPATANTINRFLSGDGNNLITALFLAHDFNKPYLIAPAMNTNMYHHPATQKSLQKLTEWGIKVLDTDSGYLACGDEGDGKLLDPEKIFEEIEKNLKLKKKNISVLITSGGTKENIDGVRYIGNMSTGNTGATIADYLIAEGYDVTFLSSQNSKQPKANCNRTEYVSFNDLNVAIKKLLSQNSFDVVVHLAAVGDYSLSEIKTEGKVYSVPFTKKIKSGSEKIELTLTKNQKIIDKIKLYSKKKEMLLFGFKLVSGSSEAESIKEVKSLLKNSNADFVVLNDYKNRTKSIQSNFILFDKTDKISSATTVEDLSEKINKIITNKLRDK